MRAAARLLAVLMLVAAGSAVAQEKHLIDRTRPGSLNPEPLPPLQNPDAAADAGQGTVRPQIDAVSRAAALDRSATDVVAPDLLDVDPQVWTHTHTELIRTAAQDPAVTRILVNAAIKKALCREARADRAWLFKVRPWYGHAEHFHVQIACPADSAECKPQGPPLPSDGCGRKLDFWFHESKLHPPSPKPKPALTLAGLPPACTQMVNAP